MRKASLAAMGVAAYLVFLAAMLPAPFVAERAHVPGVQLTDVDGTIWNGHGRASLVAPAAPFVLDDVRWRFRPASLLSGRLAWQVEARAPGLAAKAEVARGWAATVVRDLEADGDATLAAALSPFAATWHPEGRVHAAAPSLAWDGGALRGTLDAEWRGAALALSSVRPLGSYRLAVRAQDGPALFEVTTLDGPLRIAGRGTFTPPAALAFSGEARADAAASAALAPLLDLLGPRRADGARAIAWGAPAR